MDAACSACSTAVLRDGRILAAERSAAARGHAETLMPMIVRTLARAGLGFSQIAALAVTVGPGSFTGIRIALAAARGLSLALDRPVLGVTTLEAVAHAALRGSPGAAAPCLVALDARREDLYVQIFAPDGAPKTRPEAAMPETIAAGLKDPDVLVAGNAAARIAPFLRDRGLRPSIVAGDGNPDARVVARIAHHRLAGGADAETLPAAPLYLRAPDAVRPVDGGRLRP